MGFLSSLEVFLNNKIQLLTNNIFWKEKLTIEALL